MGEHGLHHGTVHTRSIYTALPQPTDGGWRGGSGGGGGAAVCGVGGTAAKPEA